jgi:DNA invertase Pin-like site-specific DNA recombinase
MTGYIPKKEKPYPDNGCAKAKAAGYEGTCLESKKFPKGCPFPRCFEEPGVLPPQEEETIKRNEEIRKLHETGWTTEEISKETKLSIRQVQRIIQNKPYKRHLNRKDSKGRNAEIRKLKKEGMPVEEIAAKFNLHPATIYVVCREDIPND